MGGDIVLFAPIASQVRHVKRQLDLSLLAFDEVVNEVVIGRFIVLEGSPSSRYLLIERADAIGFVANLRLRIAEARKVGVSRLTSQDQFYDLEVSVDGKRCVLRDFAQHGQPLVQVDLSTFMKSVDECAAGVFDTMLLLFPELGSHRDIDRLRGLLGAGRRR